MKHILLISLILILNAYSVFALNDTISIINAEQAFTLKTNGINLTGQGETICIIDTGVNYNHEAFGGCYGNNNPNSSCKVIGGYDFINNDSDPMDPLGHGTHGAGIAAAKGQMIGIAPDAKIVAIRACNNNFYGHQEADDPNPPCSDSSVRKGIDWCVSNSKKFNISVISVSIGTGSFNGNCDNLDQSMTSSVNNAVSKNISVVFASGNFGNNNAIASPACIKNAIPVGSTNKDDTISWFTDRNQLVKLLAPGHEILSVNMPGGYWYDSGTSMSAPHVAGAIALMNQYLKSVNRSKTPKELELILANSGKKIYDPESGLNFSRIDSYSALISLDQEKPAVSAKIKNSTSKLTINCSGSDLALKGVSLYVYNSTSLHQKKSRSLAGISKYSYSYTFTLKPGNYTWTCSYVDVKGNRATLVKKKIRITDNFACN